MYFNVIKYKFRTVDKISDVRHYTVNTSSGDFSIPVTDQVIDLRVDFIITLRTFSQCVCKANRILHVTKHSFVTWIHTFLDYVLYISLVRLHPD